MQFKYKHGPDVVTSSYLKKTIKKFAETLRELRSKAQGESVEEKLSFAFVTNADFSDDLWSAVRCLKSGKTPQEMGAKRQFQYLKKWCDEEGVAAEDIFPLIEFRAATSDLPAQIDHYAEPSVIGQRTPLVKRPSGYLLSWSLFERRRR